MAKKNNIRHTTTSKQKLEEPYTFKTLKIHPELRDLFPPLSSDEYKELQKSLLQRGFDRNAPIMTWNGYIADGHNRYKICQDNNIPYVVATLAFSTLDEVKDWMCSIQLGRRSLSPIQRIQIIETMRPIYEKMAKEKQILAGGDKKSDEYQKSLRQLVASPIEELNSRYVNKTNAKLASKAGTSVETYRRAIKILNSDDEELKEQVKSGEMSIRAGYMELIGKNKKESDISAAEPVESVTTTPTTPTQNQNTQNTEQKPEELEKPKEPQAPTKQDSPEQPQQKTPAKPKKNSSPFPELPEGVRKIIESQIVMSNPDEIDEEVKQICIDIKTPKSREYLESIWDYKLAIIECMRSSFSKFYDTFDSYLRDMNGRVTKSQYDECIAAAEELINKFYVHLNYAKENTMLKPEE